MPGQEEVLIYETDEKGEKIVVKSTRSDQRAFVRFVNKTSRPVNVYWRDYNGHRKRYVTMKPQSFYNADTFITHPWEFADAHTNERYVVNNKYIFRAPECLGNAKHRTTWIITVGVRSLLDTAILSIATKVKEPSQVNALGLPKPLADDLQELVKMVTKPALP